MIALKEPACIALLLHLIEDDTEYDELMLSIIHRENFLVESW